jgi:hypothetical protein
VEIYETVLRRGRELSIDAGINYGPANDALLLVAGYLNDLYSLLGDEAKADAALRDACAHMQPHRLAVLNIQKTFRLVLAIGQFREG